MSLIPAYTTLVAYTRLYVMSKTTNGEYMRGSAENYSISWLFELELYYLKEAIIVKRGESNDNTVC